MSILGSAYRLVYEARNFRVGLTDVVATVIKSDSSKIGPISLVESTESGFEGVYLANIPTSEADPIGEWIGLISSASDGLKSTFRMSMQKVSSGGGSSDISDGCLLVGTIINGKLLGSMANSSLQGQMTKQTLVGTIDSNKLLGKLTSVTLKGEKICQS